MSAMTWCASRPGWSPGSTRPWRASRASTRSGRRRGSSSPAWCSPSSSTPVPSMSPLTCGRTRQLVRRSWPRPSRPPVQAKVPRRSRMSLAAPRRSRSSRLPVGWPEPPFDATHDGGWWLSHLLGWLLTGALLMLGAPFWFDLLSRLVSLRNSGKAPEVAARDDTSATAAAIRAEATTSSDAQPGRRPGPPAPVGLDEFLGTGMATSSLPALGDPQSGTAGRLTRRLAGKKPVPQPPQSPTEGAPAGTPAQPQGPASGSRAVVETSADGPGHRYRDAQRRRRRPDE